MARLRNVNSGAIVNVDDSKVERLGAEWVSAEAEKPSEKRGPGRPKKPSDEK